MFWSLREGFSSAGCFWIGAFTGESFRASDISPISASKERRPEKQWFDPTGNFRSFSTAFIAPPPLPSGKHDRPPLARRVGQARQDVGAIRGVPRTNSPATDYTDYTKKPSSLSKRECFRNNRC